MGHMDALEVLVKHGANVRSASVNPCLLVILLIQHSQSLPVHSNIS